MHNYLHGMSIVIEVQITDFLYNNSPKLQHDLVVSVKTFNGSLLAICQNGPGYRYIVHNNNYMVAFFADLS